MRVTRRDYLQIRTVFNLSVSCHSVKLKEKTWLNCSEKFSLTMHHEFSSSCFRIKILVQKKFASIRHRWEGMIEDWKGRETLFIKSVNKTKYFWSIRKKLDGMQSPAMSLARPSHQPAFSGQSSLGSRVGITRFRGNKWETLLNNGDKDHLGHLSVPLPWMCVH